MNLLILGGTNDALLLADSLHQKGVSIAYSLAGLVRVPTVDYQVVTGGFSQYGGLNRYIEEHTIAGILDATHPYANVISDKAHQAAIASQIPYWQLDRPKWEALAEDSWFDYADWNDLWPMLGDKKSIFITTGQIDQLTLDILSKKLSTKKLIRTAIEPAAYLDAGENIDWIQAIGPFTLEEEINVMQKYGVDALISKNSGGDATVSKLHAARQLQVPVYLLKRPESLCFQDDKSIFSSVISCEEAILAYFSETYCSY